MQDTSPLQPAEPMIGKLLVASTSVSDPVLSRSVSLVVHQDPENVFAVLLNRPMSPPSGLVKMLASEGSDAGGGDQPQASEELESADEPPHGYENATPAGAMPTEAGEAVKQPGLPARRETTAEERTLAEQTVSEAAKSLGTIHFGGPLSGPVVAVHNSSELAEAEAGKGVYVAAQREMLETLVQQKPGPFRLIVGHLGWSNAQLSAERHAGFWHVIDATDEDVFAVDQDLWGRVIRRATTTSMKHWLGIEDRPICAELN